MKHVRLVEGFTEQLMAVREQLFVEEQVDLSVKAVYVPMESFDRQWIKALRKERKHKKYMDRIGMPNIQQILKR
jgi:hypothetical protein